MGLGERSDWSNPVLLNSRPSQTLRKRDRISQTEKLRAESNDSYIHSDSLGEQHNVWNIFISPILQYYLLTN
jgi:hypothetical protein